MAIPVGDHVTQYYTICSAVIPCKSTMELQLLLLLFNFCLKGIWMEDYRNFKFGRNIPLLCLTCTPIFRHKGRRSEYSSWQQLLRQRCLGWPLTWKIWKSRGIERLWVENLDKWQKSSKVVFCSVYDFITKILDGCIQWCHTFVLLCSVEGGSSSLYD